MIWLSHIYSPAGETHAKVLKTETICWIKAKDTDLWDPAYFWGLGSWWEIQRASEIHAQRRGKPRSSVIPFGLPESLWALRSPCFIGSPGKLGVACASVFWARHLRWLLVLVRAVWPGGEGHHQLQNQPTYVEVVWLWAKYLALLNFTLFTDKMKNNNITYQKNPHCNSEIQ